MSNANTPDIYQRVTDKIIASLEAGVAPWVRPWHAEVDPVPINAQFRRPYRGVNFLTLQLEAMLRGYYRSCWLTYQQAIKLGGQVRKGEQGLPVVFWKLRKVDARAETEPWLMENGLSERVVPLLRFYTVFNTAQIEGLPSTIADPAPSIPSWTSEAVAEDLIQASGAEIRHGGSRAYYQSSLDYIHLPTKDSFQGAAPYYATALHELVHWTGHSSRLNRRLSGRFGEEAYAMEELVAEMGSAFLCATCRVEGHLQHASYVSSWLRALRNDKRAIFVAGTKAQNAADFLTKSLVGLPDALERVA